MVIKGVELEVSDGITEHSSRVALKGVFQNFGDVVSCWVPPVDRRGNDKASVRFANTESAEAAKNACDAGQVFLQGMMVKANWRSSGGRRVGNSDLGELSRANDYEEGGMRQLALEDPRNRRGGRDDRRRSRSRGKRRSRSRGRRSRDRERAGDRRDRGGRRERDRSRSRERATAGMEEVAPPAPAPPPGAFTGIAPAGLPPPKAAPQGVLPPLDAVQAMQAAPDAVAAAAAIAAAVVDPKEELRKQEELKAARAKRSEQLKRGPGVAALVQGALKRAQDAPTVGKKEEEGSKPAVKKKSLADFAKEFEEREAAKDAEKDAERKLQEEEEKAQAAALKAKSQAEQEAKEARDKLKAEEAKERRERAKKEMAEAEEAMKKEAETRDQRVKASVEAAKKQQADRAAAKAAKEAESLYSDMPQPDTDGAAAAEAAMKAVAAVPAADLALPPEDPSKIVFLDVDGVLRPARAGSFDISTEGEAKPDTSDFFPAAMKALRHIMERSAAKVVLCSEWRRAETLKKALKDTFGKNRLRVWSDNTMTSMKLDSGPDALRSFAERRSKEISEWLSKHEGEVSGWVVLDDINLSIADEATAGSSKAMGPHHVQTWPLCGLTMGNAKTAVRILNGALINKVVVERPVAPVTSKDGKA
mmetsp:Transcript_98439/g.175318  ORF Transcript_98439/g.175318 Transcript_98439/m.175318 type:complete len:646 (-) Transcript_98439:203-2140(-)